MSKNVAPTTTSAVLSVVASAATIAAENPMKREFRPKDAGVKICNANDYQLVARGILSKPLYEYLASGTDDEQTLSENESAFKSWYLRPRVMRPVGYISTATTLFGRRISMPVFVSPAGVHALCDEVHGECASARACARAGTLFGLSQHATRSIEEVAASTRGSDANLWYQSYILNDRDMTLRLVRRAAAAGYRGVFLTVDSVRFGYREADARNGWNALPPPHRLVNYDEEVSRKSATGSGKKKWLAPEASVVDKSKIYGGEEDAWDQNTEQLFEQNPTWEDVRWLKKEACRDLPLVVKGVMTAEDAIEAVKAGADGVMVSNHGGRGLDGALAAIDALPEVVAAVGGRVPVLMDGGVRRGTDVLKALALGATAVGVGKPVFFALAVGGEDAVANLLEMIRREAEAAMAICGCGSVAEASRSLVTRHPSGGGHVGRYVRSKL